MYNLTFMDNQTSVSGLVEGLNTVTNDWFFGLILLVAWLVVFLVLYNRTNTSDLLIGSGFIFSVIGGLAFGAEVIPVWSVVFPVILLGFGLFMKYFGGG